MRSRVVMVHDKMQLEHFPATAWPGLDPGWVRFAEENASQGKLG